MTGVAPLGSGGGDDGAPTKLTARVVVLSVLAAIGGFLFGYDTGVVSGAMLLLKKDFALDTFYQELVVSVTVVGAFVGSLVGGVIGASSGRKPAILLASMVFMVGAALMALAPNWETVLAGRFVVGVGVGIASTTVPIYIGEAAPARLRGTLSVINLVCVSSGQFIATVVDGAFSTTHGGWRYMFGLSAVPAVIQLVGFWAMPESPRFLVSVGRRDEARRVLCTLRAPDHDVEGELSAIERASLEPQGGLRELLSKPHYRRILLLACMLQLINQITGINSIMYYNATILKLAGITSTQEAIWIAAAINAVFVASTVVGLVLVDRAGRRRLMQFSLVGVLGSLLLLAQAFFLAAGHSPAAAGVGDCAWATCNACLEHRCGFCLANKTLGQCLAADSPAAVCADSEWIARDATRALSDACPDPYSMLAIVGLGAYLASFAFGLTSMPWVINAEIFPTHLRSAGNSYATATNWAANLVVSQTFLTLTEAITRAGAFWLYAGITLVSLAYVCAALPETKGKSLEDIEALFLRRRDGYRPLAAGGDGRVDDDVHGDGKQRRAINR